MSAVGLTTAGTCGRLRRVTPRPTFVLTQRTSGARVGLDGRDVRPASLGAPHDGQHQEGELSVRPSGAATCLPLRVDVVRRVQVTPDPETRWTRVEIVESAGRWFYLDGVVG